MTNQPKAVGRIIKISKQGWGFISSKDIEFTRIFFHWTALIQTTLPFLELRTGMMVEFTPVQIPDKGWRAVHVRVLPLPAITFIEEEKEEVQDGEETNRVPLLQERQPDVDRTS